MTAPAGTDPGVHLLAYHPTNLCYKLLEDTHFPADHPDDPAGSADEAVGVHAVVALTDWEHNPDGDLTGALLWHRVRLANWTASRQEFADLPADERARHARIGPAANRGRWATHLGATLAVITSDNKVVLRSRAGKYAEDQLHDSLIAGTMMTSHVKDTGETLTIDYLRRLLYDANISLDRDVNELHPTHLAVRVSDSGLWLGGWMSLALTADQVRDIVPFPTVAVDADQRPDVPITDWCAYDLHAMTVHRAGGELLARTWLP